MLNIEKYYDEILSCCQGCESTMEMMENINNKLRKDERFNPYLSTFEELVRWFAEENGEKKGTGQINIVNTGVMNIEL